MLAVALETEVAAYIAAHAELVEVALVRAGAKFEKAGWSSDPGRRQRKRSTRSPRDHADGIRRT